MTNEPKPKFDLKERTARFGESVIRFCKKVPLNPVTTPLVNQLVKCGTSVGANYCEADDAESRQDFRHEIGISKKETSEAKHFIRMMVVAVSELKGEAELLWQEAKELNLILNSIHRKTK